MRNSINAVSDFCQPNCHINVPYELRRAREYEVLLAKKYVKKGIRKNLITSKTPGINIKVISAPEFAELSKQYGSYGAIIIQTKENGPGEIPAEYHEFTNIFQAKNVETLPDHGSHDLKINLKLRNKVPTRKHYPASLEEGEILNKYLVENLSKYFIQRSSSPAGVLVFFVRKINSELRLCVDYRGLNKISDKDKYPLPQIDEIDDNLQGVKLMSKLDLRSSYNGFRIATGDGGKIAFRTNSGLFEYLVMLLGLTKALANYLSFINSILAEQIDRSVMFYLTDILIYSKNLAIHKYNFRGVLRILQQHKIAVAPVKCEWNKTKLKFLEHMISTDSLKICTDKIVVIKG